MNPITLEWLDSRGLKWAQQLVTEGHYLRRPVDGRCCPQAYAIGIAGVCVGCLIFGRPQATRAYPWYGTLKDVANGRASCSYWGLLNLARVYLLPQVQAGGVMCIPELLPGYVDRRGVWRSRLASTAIEMACERVVLDYLLARPPVFLDEPYEIRWILSYQAPIHRGVIYRESGFERYAENEAGLVTWRCPTRPLTLGEHRRIARASGEDHRAKVYRARRQAAACEQIALFGERQEAWA